MLDNQESKARVLLTVKNNEQAKEVAREIVLNRFEKDVDIQELFMPLMEEVKGMGRMVASEIAWELFVLLELGTQPLPILPGEEFCPESSS